MKPALSKTLAEDLAAPKQASHLLSASVAFVWLFTGLAVLHPYFREVGASQLARLGLPVWLMYVACAGELLLGLRVLLGPATRSVTWVQMGAILTFTAILAVDDPMLLAHPYGVLTKNLPMLAALGGAWRLEADAEWTPTSTWLLRAGMAVIWITEGLVPKLLVVQQMEVAVVARSSLVPIPARTFLHLLGGVQIASGLGALLLRGSWLKWLLWGQLAGLVLLPMLVSAGDLDLWFHPFGPMTKNVPIIAGTLVVALRCSTSS